MFLQIFRGDSRELQSSFKGVLRKFQGRLKENLKEKAFKNISMKFCDFLVAWISWKLPEQKEGLFGGQLVGFDLVFGGSEAKSRGGACLLCG